VAVSCECGDETSCSGATDLEDGGNMFLQNVAAYSRRSTSWPVKKLAELRDGPKRFATTAPTTPHGVTAQRPARTYGSVISWQFGC
jgi:hypothetical protein